MKEIWKPVVGYEGLYEVSNLGNVKSLGRYKVNKLGRHTNCKPRILNKRVDKKGYENVYLTNIECKTKQIKVHRIVAMAFIKNPNINEYNQVNHIDGNKRNNNASNLEWCNNSMNQIHAYKNGLNHTSKDAGRKNIMVIKRDLNTMEILEEYESLAEASRKNNCSVCGIKKALFGLNKTKPKNIFMDYFLEVI